MPRREVAVSKVLGILGGLGPLAGAYFYRAVIEHTAASCDQEHLSVVLVGNAKTPDRTDFILGNTEMSPIPVMLRDLRRLITAGAEVIAIPCNTAHAFYDILRRACSFPILNIIEESVRCAVHSGAKKVGILATKGTVVSGIYQQALFDAGIPYALPSADSEEILMDLIYRAVKSSKKSNRAAYDRIVGELADKGCDTVLLGCTELSLLTVSDKMTGIAVIDSTLALASAAITACGAIPKGFPAFYTDSNKKDIFFIG